MSTLEEIKARAEKATPGPWKLWGMQVLADPVGDSNVETALPIADTTDPHRGLRTFNASFIAEARTDVPKLVNALEAVRELAAETQDEWKGHIGTHDMECHTRHAACLASLLLEVIEEALA